MKTVVVVGANRGIGLEFTRQLSENSDNRVYALCRKSSPQLSELPVKVIEGCEVRDSSSLDRACLQIPEPIDWLIHVSGILRADSLTSPDLEGLEEQLSVNSVGPMRSVMAFLPKLKEGSKIALLTSRMGSLADNSSGGYYGYRMSKAALNMMGVSLALDLKPQGISVLLLHPGFVRTDMTGNQGDLDTQSSVKKMLVLIQDKGLTETGRFWHCSGEELPW